MMRSIWADSGGGGGGIESLPSLKRRGGNYREQPKGIRTGEVGRLQERLEDYSGSWKTIYSL